MSEKLLLGTKTKILPIRAIVLTNETCKVPSKVFGFYESKTLKFRHWESKMKLTKLALIAALSMGSTLTQAAVFTDSFNSYTADQLNWAPQGGWYYGFVGDMTTVGKVDIIGSGGGYDFLPGNGSYVDLDGSVGGTLVALNHGIPLIGGQAYTLSFDLAGNHRDNNEDFVTAHFGDAFATFGIGSNLAFTNHTLNFTPDVDGAYSFGFADSNTFNNNNVGALLDNVSVTAVPEPETYALLLGGLALVGFSTRRRDTEV